MARKTMKVKRPKIEEEARSSRKYLIYGSVGIGVILLGVLLVISMRGPGTLRGLINYGSQTRGHDNTTVIDSPERPPAGGVHHDVWQNCGIYDEPVLAENVIHSMEHGAVWLTYSSELNENDIAYLQDLVRGQTFIILSPYPTQESAVVATAWSVQIEADSVTDNRIEEFIERYRLGPTTPERGASCSGGVGVPIG